MLKKIRKTLSRLSKLDTIHNELIRSAVRQDQILLTLGMQLAEANLRKDSSDIKDYEFKIFSQWGDDGIIQYLINAVPDINETFIEFGVEDYLESNTRFLLLKDNWRGLIIDGSQSNIEAIKKSDYYWRHDLTGICEFVNRDNINSILEAHDYSEEIGLLSIDIDGNDYWVWEAIEQVQPVIVIIEYNSVFGFERAITVPYRSDFSRSKAHHSHLFFGASLTALCDLSSKKGYTFVGCNSAGVNAYFIRNDKLGKINAAKANEGYIVSKMRESRGKAYELTFLRGQQRLKAIKGLEVFNTRESIMEKL